VALVQSGVGFPDRYQGKVGKEIPFYKVSDMNISGNEREMVYENNSISVEACRELRAFLFPKGSTIFPKIGGAIATNKKRMTTRDCCVDNNVMGVVPIPERITSDFLFYFFLAHDLSEFANKAHLPSIKKTVVEGWPIRLPATLAEQQRIVGILDIVFEGIATAKADAEKNRQNARAIFERHLDFLFTQRGKSWTNKPLGEISQFKNGLNYSKSSGGQTLPVVGVADFQDNYLVPLSELQSATIDGDLAENYAIHQNDILTVRSNGSKHLVGRCMLVGNVDEIVSYSGFIIRVRFDAKCIYPQFLLHFMKCNNTRNILTSDGGGANITNINQEKLSSLLVPIPRYNDQVQLASALDSMRAETRRLESIYEQKLASLEALKKSLLYQAFTGNL
jgi:type I restriction enzyme S subunit